MADEQHEWLDKEAAEKMLRREPVDPSDGRSRRDAERLAAALDAAARTARPAVAELPGEAAALAAFRAARNPDLRTAAVPEPADSVSAARTAGTDGFSEPESESGMLAPVHIRSAGSGAAGSRGPRPMRWSRPIRFGLVASLACCAIGGVAVAAGTGMLPGPFGRHAPTPATSVSAAASPEELGSGLATDEETPAPPPGSPGHGTATPGEPGPGRTGGQESDRPDDGGRPTAGGPDGAGEDGTGDNRSGDVGGDATGGADATTGPGGQEGDGTAGDADGRTSTWYAKSLKACRDYRDGKLDDERRTRLEALAKGARNLDRFCDRLLDQADGQSGDGQSGDGQSGDGKSGSSQNGSSQDGDGQDGDDPAGSDDSSQGGSGSLPSIRFSPSPAAPPSPSFSAAAGGSDLSHSPAPALSVAAR
ncbi:hypothetical protein [Streptomyces sp. NBC_01013]|uniref:hypothetical protein n=1 Tax=Streptomyces sp. NBC_01013 TaxID=2903718 RepID=UPI00386715F7|nr:hypothetical protein OG538_13495 [Streptomyces sp. NBC_01013]